MAKFYECGVCNLIHPWGWNGDCRNNQNRLTLDALAPDDELVSWEDRIAADQPKTFEQLVSDLERVLVDEFKQWCAEQGLPWLSADELICEDITKEQRTHISKFIEIWETWETLNNEVYERQQRKEKASAETR